MACLDKPRGVQEGVVQIKHQQQLLAPQNPLQACLSAQGQVSHIFLCPASGYTTVTFQACCEASLMRTHVDQHTHLMRSAS